MLDPYHIFDPENPSISKTELDLIASSPRKYYEWVIQNRRPKGSRALIVGQAFHASVLEPLVFEDEFAVVPEELASVKKTTKAGKEAHAAWRAEQLNPKGEEKEILTFAEGQQIAGMTNSIFANPLSRKLIENALYVEKAFYAEMETHPGVRLRCKPDLITNDRVIVDLKSSGSSLADWHAKSAEPFRYDVQEVHYTETLGWAGEEVRDFLFIVAEKNPPFGCAVFGLKGDDIGQARVEWTEDIETYQRCRESGVWPATFAQQEKPYRRSLPGWRSRRRFHIGGFDR